VRPQRVGLEGPEALGGLVGQICYRAADLGFLLGQEGHRLEQYSRHLRRAKGSRCSGPKFQWAWWQRGRENGSGRTGEGGAISKGGCRDYGPVTGNAPGAQNPDQCVSRKVMDSLGGETVA
jgi:hypothetical protein